MLIPVVPLLAMVLTEGAPAPVNVGPGEFRLPPGARCSDCMMTNERLCELAPRQRYRLIVSGARIEIDQQSCFGEPQCVQSSREQWMTFEKIEADHGASRPPPSTKFHTYSTSGIFTSPKTKGVRIRPDTRYFIVANDLSSVPDAPEGSLAILMACPLPD